MAVAYVGATESIRTLTTDPYTFSHTVGSTAKGLVLLAAHGTSSTDHAPVTAAVTVGGKAMGKVCTATSTTSGGEPGRTDIWFLGHDLPAAGAQTVSVDLTSATGDDIAFVMVELTGDRDLEVLAVAAVSTAANSANPTSGVIAYGGRTGIAIGTVYSGVAAPGSLTVNANMSAVHDHDFGLFVSRVDRQTTPGSSDFTFSYTAASDDWCLCVVAITEERPSPFRDHILGLSPAGYWRLGEPAGCLTAFDRGPNLLHGVYTASPTLAVAGSLVGDGDTSVTFNGTTQYVTVPDNAALDLGDTLTLQFCAKSSANLDRVMMLRGATSWDLSRVAEVLYFSKNGTGAMMHTSTTLPSDGTWRCVAFTKSGSTRAAYMDGVDVTVLDTNQTLSNTATAFNFGASGTDFFSGTLDEVALFATALTAAQVGHLATLADGRFTPYATPMPQLLAR